MAKNKLSDLNDHLFAQLERLGEENISPEELEKEVQRAKAIKDVAQQIINSSKVTLQAMKLVSDGNYNRNELPSTFGLAEQLNK